MAPKVVSATALCWRTLELLRDVKGAADKLIHEGDTRRAISRYRKVWMAVRYSQILCMPSRVEDDEYAVAVDMHEDLAWAVAELVMLGFSSLMSEWFALLGTWLQDFKDYEMISGAQQDFLRVLRRLPEPAKGAMFKVTHGEACGVSNWLWVMFNVFFNREAPSVANGLARLENYCSSIQDLPHFQHDLQWLRRLGGGSLAVRFSAYLAKNPFSRCH